MMRRRTILAVFMLLVAGAVINVAVAWIGAAVNIADTHTRAAAAKYAHPNTGQEAWWRITVYQSAMSTTFACYWWKDNLGRGTENDPAALLPHWAADMAQPNGDMPSSFGGGFLQGGWLHASGWPCRSFYVRIENTSALGVRVQYGMAVGPRLQNGHGYLPLGPIWPGFVMNSLIYGGVLWVMWAGLLALRRMIRRQRGQCPACAYPIGTSGVCTECGAAVMPCAVT